MDTALFKPPGGGPPKPFKEFTRDERLWDLRGQLEQEHRHLTWLYGVMNFYQPSVRDIGHLPEMTVQDFVDTCNKSVPVYILPDARWRLLLIVLHNYIYRRWFRPYRSEIERERFICKFIRPWGLPDSGTTPLQSIIDTIVSMNHSICTHVQALRCTYVERIALLANNDDLKWHYSKRFVKDHEYHVLQPLFRALLIVIDSENYNNEDSKTAGRVPVYLVRTGIEDGLSAPITFDSITNKIESCLGKSENVIKTTLETAVDFVISLEAREAAVFGLQPNPVAASVTDRWLVARWKYIAPDEPLIAPSSRLISNERASEWGWSGAGEHYDSFVMDGHERRAIRFEAMRVAGELPT